MAMASKNDPLINMFFHEFDEEKALQRQGMIIKKYKDDEYFVMFFNFLDGSASPDREIISFKEKANFQFYDTAKDMRLAYAQYYNWDESSIKAQELLIKCAGCK